MYKTVYTEVEVEVDLSDFKTNELIEEIKNRGLAGNEDIKELVETIWLKRRLGNDNFLKELDQLIYEVIGKVI